MALHPKYFGHILARCALPARTRLHPFTNLHVFSYALLIPKRIAIRFSSGDAGIVVANKTYYRDPDRWPNETFDPAG